MHRSSLSRQPNHQRNISTLSENPTQRIHFLLPFSTQYSTTFQSLSIPPWTPFKPINSRFWWSRRTTILRVPRTSFSVPPVSYRRPFYSHHPWMDTFQEGLPIEGHTAYRSYRWNEPRSGVGNDRTMPEYGHVSPRREWNQQDGCVLHPFHE